MNKEAWVKYATPVCAAFLDGKTHPETVRLQATFRSRLSPDSVGRTAFQNIYDLVSSWPCWSLVQQDQDWETVIRFQVSPLPVMSATSALPSTNASKTSSSGSGTGTGLASGTINDPPPSAHRASHYIESDESSVCVKCYSITPCHESPLPLALASSPDVNQINGVTFESFTHCESHFKLSPSSSYSDVDVIKRKIFTLETRFRWQYEFDLVWSSPYVEDRENVSPSLIFKQEPKCQFRITCNFLNTTDVSVEYLSESLLLKIHESIPALYKASDGTSVSIPST